MADAGEVELEEYKSALKEWGNYSSDTNGTLDIVNEIIDHETNLASYIGSADGSTEGSLYAKRAEQQSVIMVRYDYQRKVLSSQIFKQHYLRIPGMTILKSIAASLMSRIETASGRS